MEHFKSAFDCAHEKLKKYLTVGQPGRIFYPQKAIFLDHTKDIYDAVIPGKTNIN